MNKLKTTNCYPKKTLTRNASKLFNVRRFAAYTTYFSFVISSRNMNEKKPYTERKREKSPENCCFIHNNSNSKFFNLLQIVCVSNLRYYNVSKPPLAIIECRSGSHVCDRRFNSFLRFICFLFIFSLSKYVLI